TRVTGSAVEQAVTLAITNKDEVAPSFSSGGTATPVEENSGAGQVVYDAAATDAGDVSGGITYTLKAVGDYALFSIHATSGAVTLIGNPNHETKGSYSFTVIASDGVHAGVEQAVTLAIINLDEVAPSFSSAGTATPVEENSGAGQVVYDADATDAGDVSGGITYSLTSMADSGSFSINPTTGVVTLTGNPDYEFKSSYSFTVFVSDGVNAGVERAVTLAITNVDEVEPVITSGATATTLAENCGSGQLVYTATATDLVDISAGVTYSLKAVDDFAAFSINSTTGAVTLTGNPNYETKASYIFTVVASDGVTTSTEKSVTLAITNLDEVAPVFSSGGTATALDENSGAGQVVYVANATDTADVSAGITYSLKSGGDAGLFSIDGSTGAVTLIDDPNHEVKSSYGFTVLASDGVTTPTEQAVTLAITNLDEVSPVITSGTIATPLDENSGALQWVYLATASDSDDVSGGVTYTLKAVDDYALFQIDTSTGQVDLLDNPNFESKSLYAFTVVASDGVNPFVEQAVTLEINNRDESSPTITSSPTGSIDENIGSGQVVYTITASDDGDVSNGVTYAVLAVGDYFDLNYDTATGQVTLNLDPNYEFQSSYTFTVLATDNINPHVEQVVTLTVNNIDEVAPSFISGATATAIAENSGAGQVVYDADATDAADVSGGIAYSLKAGGDAGLLTIDGSTGAVTLTGNPNYETKSSYSFTVIASDGVNAGVEKAVTLAITNVDESAPTFTSGSIATSIAENSGAGQAVYTAHATDTGDVTLGVIYSLKSGVGDQTSFSIDTMTGVVLLNGNPNYEAKSSYSFTVVASDGVTTPAEKVVTLTIANADDPGTGGVTITGTAATGNTLTAANDLADQDAPLGSVSYQWKADGVAISGATSSTLLLNNSHIGQVITVTASATDGLGNTDSATSSPTSAVTYTPQAVISLASLDGSNGVRFDGYAHDWAGSSVSNVGDVNGDGIDDLLIGAFRANSGYSGASYLVFGTTSGWTSAIDLANLNGSNGVRLNGVTAQDRSGRSVGAAGDVNGDGYADLIIGAYHASNHGTNSGSAYVVFGQSAWNAGTLSLASLDGGNGFRLDGPGSGNGMLAGVSVHGAGDINGDGWDDLIVGAMLAETYDGLVSGASYVVFGKANGWSAIQNLGELDGSNGFRLDGVENNDWSGYSVKGAGDINGDGIDDLIVGSPFASPSGSVVTGASYVVFGKLGAWSSTLDLSTLDGGNGFRLNGSAVGDGSGSSVSGAGDLNGDGYDDLIIGAKGASVAGAAVGSAFVVFGHSQGAGWSPSLDLSSLSGTLGFRLNGLANGDKTGISVSGAGDINGDGLADLLIGASYADPGGVGNAGATYLLFGQDSWGTGAVSIDLATLNGTTDGIRLNGVSANELSGNSISLAGDVNGDGYDDLLIGAIGTGEGGLHAGAGYVLFGGNFSNLSPAGQTLLGGAV
ncbi:MAG: cadherin domain-containing protein, partial [Magnetococcales bacterium]|nr:cadherin domain-containing protein [Magnetococcales bacterium]